MGFAAGKIFQRVKVPRVVAFVLIGLILASTGVISSCVIEHLQPIIDLALGFIGFTIGSELDIKSLLKDSKKLFIILSCEVMGAFGLVTVAFYLMFGEFYISLIFGALASATAPAATIEVIKECYAKGELTQRIICIIALDDIIAIILFDFILSHASPQVVGGLITILAPLLNIAFALLLGGLLGYVLVKVEELFRSETEWLILTVGSVILCTGVAQIFGISSILTNIALGTIMANAHTIELKTFEKRLDIIILPLFIGFFVLIGARLNLEIIIEVGVITTIYVCARAVGKILGAYGGAKLAHELPKIANNLGLSLISQAGVALALAYLASNQLAMLGNAAAGLLIFNVITASVIVTDLIGPLAVKFSLKRVGECPMKPSYSET
ncbi:MAG: cation:proton antiporter [Promethearchaeota archaeon]